MDGGPDEFAWIDRLKPLTRGDPRALDLMDDAAVIAGRPGFELVISQDAMVQGVHFMMDESPDLIAKRLLRTSLSDLAAKAAEPFGYFLMTAWPEEVTWAGRDAFIRGLAQDGEAFGVALLGGDTVRAAGPMTLVATVLGWAPKGRTVKRSGARAGDLAIVCGVIGDGWLGLKAARGEIDDPGGRLSAHYRAPRPLLGLRDLLRAAARAAADVSDGLVADAAHVARASGLGLRLELDAMPLSVAATTWRAAQGDQVAARVALATGGDDYAIICAVDPADAAAFLQRAADLGEAVATVGVFTAAPGLEVTLSGQGLHVDKSGWRH